MRWVTLMRYDTTLKELFHSPPQKLLQWQNLLVGDRGGFHMRKQNIKYSLTLILLLAIIVLPPIADLNSNYHYKILSDFKSAADPIKQSENQPSTRSEIIDDDVLVVKGKFNGKDVTVFVDTGADFGGVSAKLAAGLKPIPGQKVKYAGATGKLKESFIYQIDGLEIGGIVL